MKGILVRACWFGGITLLGTIMVPVTALSQAPPSYGQYYQGNFAKYGGQRQVDSSSRYLYDKYFYHSPAVSPYMNLFRPGTMSDTSYQAFVRPEQQRREAAERIQSSYLQQRKLEGNIGHTQFPGANFIGATPRDVYWKPPAPEIPSNPAYRNHWYGSWAQ